MFRRSSRLRWSTSSLIRRIYVGQSAASSKEGSSGNDGKFEKRVLGAFKATHPLSHAELCKTAIAFLARPIMEFPVVIFSGNSACIIDGVY